MAEKNERPIKVVAENRKARFNYAIEDTIEAGIALTGTEVKSIRSGKSTIAESYADSKDGEIWLINANIPEYLQGNRFNHEPKRPRKLLLHKQADQQADRRGRARGHDADPAKALFQRARAGETAAGGRQGQEAARQARERERSATGAARRAA